MRVTGFLAIVFSSLLAGCSQQGVDPEVLAELDALEARQTALMERFAALEEENALLKETLSKAVQPVLQPTIPESPAVASASITNILGDERLDALAQSIGATMTARLLPDLEQIIDGRIASQIGTAEDIEDFFVDAFDQQMDDREERERQARIAQDRERRERSARVQVKRMGDVVGISESQSDNVVEAYLVRNQSTRDAVRELRENGEFSMTAYREIRDASEAAYQEEMQDIMTEAQYEIYQTKWRGSQGKPSRSQSQEE